MNVTIVDDYAEIDNSISPFLALSPSVIASRLASTLSETPFSFSLSLRRHEPVRLEGDRAQEHRPGQMAMLMEGFRQWLPDDFGEGEGILGEGLESDDGVVRWSGSDHDLGSRIMGDDFRQRMMELSRAGKRELLLHPGLSLARELTSPRPQTSKKQSSSSMRTSVAREL